MRWGPGEVCDGEGVPEAVACVLWSVPSRGEWTRKCPRVPCDRWEQPAHGLSVRVSLSLSQVTVPHAFPVQLRHPPGQNITAVPGPPHSDRHAAYLVLNSLEGNQGKVPYSIDTQASDDGKQRV